MSPIRLNIIANYAGSFWTALMSLIFVPVYIKYMGIEAYGLVGIFASLQALFYVLDFGLSATMTREMARLRTVDPSGVQARTLTRTLEIIYWGVALCLGAAVVALADPIARYWVKPDRLDPETVRHALMITGVVVALRWPVSFYVGGLQGLDRQPLRNAIQSGCATLRGVGAIGVLAFVSPTIQAFFTWQIVVSAVETASMAAALRRSLPGGGRAAFSMEALKSVWRFSAGVTGISVTVVLLTQSDKIILSKMLSLELFGYYALARTAASMIHVLPGPMLNAVYPTLTRLAAARDPDRLADLYHKSCQTAAIVLVPASLALIIFGDSVLTLWSGDPVIVRHTGPILSIVAIGTFLNGFMRMPYLAQLAHGWTTLGLYQNIVSVIIVVPLTVLLAESYGAVGAAYAWVALNAGYVIVTPHIMHRRILKGLRCEWYINDVALPALVGLAVGLTCKGLMPPALPDAVLAAYVLGASGLCLLACFLAAPRVRSQVGFANGARLWRSL